MNIITSEKSYLPKKNIILAEGRIVDKKGFCYCVCYFNSSIVHVCITTSTGATIQRSVAEIIIRIIWN